MPVLVHDSERHDQTPDHASLDSTDPGWLGPIPTQPPQSGYCRVYVLAEAGGVDEGLHGMPLIGRSGQYCRELLSAVGIPLVECALANVFSWRPPRNDVKAFLIKRPEHYPDLAPVDTGLYCDPHWFGELHRLQQELMYFKPNLVLALGNTAIWALTNQRPFVSRLRGTVFEARIIPGLKVLATYHPAAALRDWTRRPIVLSDFHKAAYEAQFPSIVRAKRLTLVPTSVEEVEDFCAWAFTNAAYIGLDIETANSPTHQITSISISTSPFHGIGIPFTAAPRASMLPKAASPHVWSPEQEQRIWDAIAHLVEPPNGPPIAMQNGQYDAQWLWELARISCRTWEDTMFIQRARFPGMPAGLDFLASTVTLEPAWKHLRPKGTRVTKRDA